MTFDYGAPAELFMAKRKGGSRQPLGYRRFATAAEAIRFAIEDFPTMRTLGAWMHGGGRRPTIDTAGRFDVMAPLTYIAARNQFSACLATLPRQGAQLSSPKLG
jgi:hypothetical protein